MTDFAKEVADRIESYETENKMKAAAAAFMRESNQPKYSYNFSFLGRPIIQYPQDMVILQQLIWEIKPDLIIETGIAHGGSLIMSAAMQALVDVCEAADSGDDINPANSKRKVLGIDIDIRAHNRAAIEAHPMASRIEMLQGSSIDPSIIKQVHEFAKDYKKILICMDSNHTHDHVLAELRAYADLTSVGSYCVVFDTVVEDLPSEMFPDRPWEPGNNPKSAVFEFLKEATHFEIDKKIDNQLLISVAPDGFLKRVK